MNNKHLYIFPVILLLLNSCIVKFIPSVQEEKELLVVQGLITDQHEADTIKLSKSLPLGLKSDARPVTGSLVRISDDFGNTFSLTEISPGTYITDSSIFQGVPGRFYTLHITTNSSNKNLSYESLPSEMKAVPPIDSVYYNKINLAPAFENYKGIDACQIYLDTHDPTNSCRYFRWDYLETWKLRLLFAVPNNTCWVSEKSHEVLVKSTVAFNESRVTALPINYITNTTDRLKTTYSILVNQYSLNEDEYNYWDKVKNVVVQVGGLYDIIPASVPSNITCIENPEEKVLGYFSVSAKSSERIFIRDNFAGIINPYADCITGTIDTDTPPGLNVSVWILIPHGCSIPCTPTFEITTHKECTDCTLRGTNIRPAFWRDDK